VPVATQGSHGKAKVSPRGQPASEASERLGATQLPRSSPERPGRRGRRGTDEGTTRQPSGGCGFHPRASWKDGGLRVRRAVRHRPRSVAGGPTHPARRRRGTACREVPWHVGETGEDALPSGRVAQTVRSAATASGREVCERPQGVTPAGSATGREHASAPVWPDPDPPEHGHRLGGDPGKEGRGTPPRVPAPRAARVVSASGAGTGHTGTRRVPAHGVGCQLLTSVWTVQPAARARKVPGSTDGLRTARPGGDAWQLQVGNPGEHRAPPSGNGGAAPRTPGRSKAPRSGRSPRGGRRNDEGATARGDAGAAGTGGEGSGGSSIGGEAQRPRQACPGRSAETRWTP
jgi:hypothetical protein